MIDNQIRVDEAVESSNNKVNTLIVEANVTKATYNESSQVASFCDCYVENSDYAFVDALENSDEDLSLFSSNQFAGHKKRCIFWQETDTNE